MEAPAAEVARHYSRRGILDAVTTALRSLGLLDRPLTPDDLAPLDQFHTGGRDATVELARLAGLGASSRVLDVGGGVGGPARTLAQLFGCRVTVLDVTPAYCELGVWLSERTGYSALVAFEVGDAQAMRFLPHSFDVVWTQHSSMNLPDKRAFFRNCHHLLVAGGRYAFHEVLADRRTPHYPVPWASTPATSWLHDSEQMQTELQGAGFDIAHWQDDTAASLQWLAARRRTRTPPALGLHLLLGDGVGAAFANHARNLAEGRTRIVRGIAVAR